MARNKVAPEDGRQYLARQEKDWRDEAWLRRQLEGLGGGGGR
jgi:hypothetical protein